MEGGRVPVNVIDNVSWRGWTCEKKLFVCRVTGMHVASVRLAY